MSWDILGHEWAADLLAEHIARGEERHAYLITGVPGIGRRTLALRFAQALNCQNPPQPGQPCRACRACTQIEKMQHPDLFVVQSAGEGSDLKVDQVRELQHSLSLAPYEARYKVALLLRFQEATANAQNALLKTLEEAPQRVILLLVSDHAESLLPTIVSRCEVLRLRPMAVDQLSQVLQKTAMLNPRDATLLAHITGGRLGAARQLMGDMSLLEQRGEWLEELRRLLGEPRRERFVYANGMAEGRKNSPETFRQILLIWLSYWRDVALLAAGSEAPLTNLDLEEDLREVASQVDLSTALRQVRAIEDGLDRLKRNVNPRLLAEVLLLDWPRIIVHTHEAEYD